jgi:dTDP-4-dehydrorhamnose reductase
MIVWLVGAGGMLAQAVKRGLEAGGKTVLATDMDVNLTSRDAVLAYAQGKAISHIVNCAAYTAVDDAEKDETKATRVNADGVAHLAEAAEISGAALVHFSTDYVFDGKKGEPYVETDATGPINAYGRSKLLGEQRIAERASTHSELRWYVIRTSWLYGEHGKNFVDTMHRLMLEKDELSVVSDQVGRPTYTRDLARAALELSGVSGRAAPSGIYHFANSGITSWHGFAERIRSELGTLGIPLRTKTVRAIPTSAFPRPATRPQYSVLSTEKIEPHLSAPPPAWESALADYLAGSVSKSA